MKRLKIFAAVIISALILLTIAQTVVAQTTGIDLIALMQQKAMALSGQKAASVNSELEQAKQAAEDDTLKYIDSYVSDIQKSLDQYTTQQTEAAKQQIQAKANEIKKTLDPQKQKIINDAKAQEKAAIDAQVTNTLNDLQKELDAKIQEKLK